MKPISDYSTDDKLRLLLQGPPGVGKTTLACQFPGAYIADCDVNLGGALRWLKTVGKQLPVGYDTIDRDEAGKEVPAPMRYERMVKCLQVAAQAPEVQTIVLDSATRISDYIISHVLRTNPTKTGAMEMTSWGFYLAFWKNLISAMIACNKHFVLIAHERVEKDEVDQSLKYFINLPGQIKDIIGALFTDVWRAEVQEVAGMPPKHNWLIRTMPSYRFQLKNSLGLPTTFSFDWKTISDKLTK